MRGLPQRLAADRGLRGGDRFGPTALGREVRRPSPPARAAGAGATPRSRSVPSPRTSRGADRPTATRPRRRSPRAARCGAFGSSRRCAKRFDSRMSTSTPDDRLMSRSATSTAARASPRNRVERRTQARRRVLLGRVGPQRARDHRPRHGSVAEREQREQALRPARQRRRGVAGAELEAAEHREREILAGTRGRTRRRACSAHGVLASRAGPGAGRPK